MQQSLYDKGLETLQKITGTSGSTVIESLKKISPEIADWIIEFSYGDVLSRTKLIHTFAAIYSSFSETY